MFGEQAGTVVVGGEGLIVAYGPFADFRDLPHGGAAALLLHVVEDPEQREVTVRVLPQGGVEISAGVVVEQQGPQIERREAPQRVVKGANHRRDSPG